MKNEPTLPMEEIDAKVATRWYLVASLDAKETDRHLRPALYPPRSDKSIIPPMMTLRKAADAVKKASSCQESPLPGKPTLMTNSFMIGDELLCWESDYSMSCVYRRELPKG